MIYETKLTKEKINDILDDILDKISKYGIVYYNTRKGISRCLFFRW
jgi:hypothetical protein